MAICLLLVIVCYGMLELRNSFCGSMEDNEDLRPILAVVANDEENQIVPNDKNYWTQNISCEITIYNESKNSKTEPNPCLQVATSFPPFEPIPVHRSYNLSPA